MGAITSRKSRDGNSWLASSLLCLAISVIVMNMTETILTWRDSTSEAWQTNRAKLLANRFSIEWGMDALKNFPVGENADYQRGFEAAGKLNDEAFKKATTDIVAAEVASNCRNGRWAVMVLVALGLLFGVAVYRNHLLKKANRRIAELEATEARGNKPDAPR